MKKLFAILMSIMMIACFMPTMAFADTTASVPNAEITAEVGKDITGTATITVEGGDNFKDPLTADQSNVWVSNLPEGVSYTVAKNEADNTKATITFSGKSNTPATTLLSFKIPAGQLVGDNTPEQEVTGNITLKITGYTVTVTAGNGMAKTSGNNANTEQRDLGGSVAMQELSFTAQEGYYFRPDYKGATAEELKGLTVTVAKGGRSITVSGTPNGDVSITLPDASAKTKEDTPKATFTATSENGGTLGGVDTAMKYSVDGGKKWIAVTGEKMEITDVTVANGVKVKKMSRDLDTWLDSDVQTINVEQQDVPAKDSVKAIACTAAGKDGKLTGVTTEMEYQEKGKEWKDGTGEAITGLTAGTYYVRAKASGPKLASTNLELEIKGYPTATADVPDVIKGITTVELKATDITITLAMA